MLGTGVFPSLRLTKEEVRSLRHWVIVWGHGGVDRVCSPVSEQTQGQRSTPQGLWGCGGDSWRPGQKDPLVLRGSLPFVQTFAR